MNRIDIESGKDDGELLGASSQVAREDEDIIELDGEELLTVDDEERSADAGDLDYEPDDRRDY